MILVYSLTTGERVRIRLALQRLQLAYILLWLHDDDVEFWREQADESNKFAQTDAHAQRRDLHLKTPTILYFRSKEISLSEVVWNGR